MMLSLIFKALVTTVVVKKIADTVKEKKENTVEPNKDNKVDTGTVKELYIIKLMRRGEDSYVIINDWGISTTKNKFEATRFDDYDKANFKAMEVVMECCESGVHTQVEDLTT